MELWTSSGIVETYETTLEPKEKAAHRIEDMFPGTAERIFRLRDRPGRLRRFRGRLLVTNNSMAALNGQVASQDRASPSSSTRANWRPEEGSSRRG